jgi:hypothetical protein
LLLALLEPALSEAWFEVALDLAKKPVPRASPARIGTTVWHLLHLDVRALLPRLDATLLLQALEQVLPGQPIFEHGAHTSSVKWLDE